MMPRLLSLLPMAALLSSSPGTRAAEPFRHTLVSAARGIHVDQWTLTHRDLGTPSPWSIRKLTLKGGRQEGVDVIVVDNGALTFTVVPTRGMSILEVTAGDVRLGWESPVREVVHPQFIRLDSRGGLGWLEGFNEAVVRCGLEWAGHPGKDEFINNAGEKAEMQLTLHGKIANIPASEVEIVVEPTPPFRLRVRGRVDERMFYGPKLELWTEISTDPGTASFRIDDDVTNQGSNEQEFQLIYHANFGRPLLGEGAKFVAPIRKLTPFNAQAARDVERYAEYAGPTPGFIEQVYCIHPLAEANGQTMILLQNARADRGVTMRFSLEQLPYLTLWKNTATIAEGYVTGLEPGTGFPYNRRIERRAGRVPKLAPGATRRFTIQSDILLSQDDMTRASAEIRRIQGPREPQLDKLPEKNE